MLKEGIFRKPRLKTNDILARYSELFTGNVINVSGSNDLDKNATLFEYYFGNYDNGQRYKNYFSNAKSYSVSNYPGDETEIILDKTDMIFLDLEEAIPSKYFNKYEVVFNHTVFEHIFDVFKAFMHLCQLSNDIVIFIVPQFQQIHDYERGYKDYWRFTPFTVDKLFEQNGFTVLYRETTTGFSESMYLFYIASRNPEKWITKFPKLLPVEKYINSNNNGSNFTIFSKYLLYFDIYFRRFVNVFKR